MILCNTRYVFLIAMLFSIFFPNCGGRLPDGAGSNHEILVLADSGDWQKLEGIVDEVFERTIETPQVEKIFTVRRREPEKFDFYKKWRNLLLLSSLKSKGETARLIRSLLSREALEKVMGGEAWVFVKRDVWAEKQVLMILTARDTEELEQRIAENGDEMFQMIEDHLDRRVKDRLYEKGEQYELEEELSRKYGWTVRVPGGYIIQKEEPDSNFIWLRKPNPDRWLFVYWEDDVDASKLDEVWCRGKRDEVCSLFYEGDRIVPEKVRVERTLVDGNPAIKLAGLWRNDEKMAGGPFYSYCFIDSKSGRFFLVDAAVFAPEVQKEPYLRQVDIVARTFSTRGL